MKQNFIRIISCLLVLSITLTTLPFQSFISSFAEEIGEELWDGEDRAAEEAIADAQAPNIPGLSAGDWKKAEADGRAMNFFTTQLKLTLPINIPAI